MYWVLLFARPVHAQRATLLLEIELLGVWLFFVLGGQPSFSVSTGILPRTPPFRFLLPFSNPVFFLLLGSFPVAVPFFLPFLF